MTRYVITRINQLTMMSFFQVCKQLGLFNVDKLIFWFLRVIKNISCQKYCFLL